MAQQLVDVGSSPNDGTGDDLRTAMGKLNANETELYGRTEGFDSDASAPAQSVYVDASGNVGLGTTSPGAHLEIEDLGGTSQALLIDVNDMGDVANEYALLLDVDVADFAPSQNSNHHGRRVSMVSAATTPTDSDGDREIVYGDRIDVNVNGAAFRSFGVFADVDVSGPDVTQTGSARGGDFSAGTSHSDSTGGGPALSGVEAEAAPAHTAGSVATARGINARVQQTGSGGTVASADAVRAEIDHDAGTLTEAAQFRGVTTGSPGTSWGLNSTGADKSLIEGADASETPLTVRAENASFTGDVLSVESDRAAGTAFDLITATTDADGTPDVEFRVRGDGEVTADGSFTGSGADVAEVKRWADGNPKAEDRIGLTVVHVGREIRPARPDDDPTQIFGAVSATAFVVGDAGALAWAGKYLKDDFGRPVMERYTLLTWVETTVEPRTKRKITPRRVPVERSMVLQDGQPVPVRQMVREEVEVQVPIETKIRRAYHADRLPPGVVAPSTAERLTEGPDGKPLLRKRLNPDFDPARPYDPRAARPEWDEIGMVGTLRVREGQPVGDRWIDLGEVAPGVREWFVR